MLAPAGSPTEGWGEVSGVSGGTPQWRSAGQIKEKGTCVHVEEVSQGMGQSSSTELQCCVPCWKFYCARLAF